MQKSICHFSFHRRWDSENWTLDRLAEEVKRLGVEGVDFHVRFLGSSTEAAGLIKGALSKHGLILSGLSMSNNFNQVDSSQFKTEVQTVKEWLAVAAQVEAPVSRIFGGHIIAENLWDESAKASGRQRILDGLGQVVGEAEKLGVVLALENHGGLPCTGEEQVEVIETINSPCLKATVDVGNYMQGGQEAQLGTAIVAKHCAYVHFKDFKKVPDNSTPWGWKLVPCIVGQGDVDHAACLKALAAGGYDGFVALEYEGHEDETVGVPQSVEFMNQMI
ncbi:MAG: TIM barrel protein [Actinobacteria bacterium]|nr:TIM barrel protein [Actinomycetota bacterium]